MENVGRKRMTYDFKERLEFSMGSRKETDAETIMVLLDGCLEVNANDAEGDAPYGLYAGLVSKLKTCINHQSESYGTSGMVYWAEESLSLIAKSLELATNS
jgi:hypothetical protein